MTAPSIQGFLQGFQKVYLYCKKKWHFKSWRAVSILLSLSVLTVLNCFEDEMPVIVKHSPVTAQKTAVVKRLLNKSDLLDPLIL